MRKTAAFIKLDLYMVKQYAKQLFMLLLVCVAMTYFLDWTALILYPIMVLSLFNAYPFIAMEKTNAETLYAVLPLSRKDVVTGRYIFTLFLEAATVALILLLTFVYSMVIKNPPAVSEIMLIVSGCSFLFALIVSVQYPLYFRYGYSKSRIASAILLMLIMAAGTALTFDKLSHNIASNFDIARLLNGKPLWLSVMLVGAGLLLMYLSSLLSQWIYARKE